MAHEAVRTLRSAAQRLPEVLPRVPALLNALQASQAGYPTRASGSEHVGAPVRLWCETHDQDHDECERAELDVTACRCVPVATTSDPTGELALSFDRARADERRVIALARQLAHVTDELGRLAAAYLDVTQPDATPADEGAPPGCRSCARVTRPDGGRWWSPIHATGDVRGNLDEPKPLCRWCWSWTRDTGALPTRKQVADHLAGLRVYRPGAPRR